MKSVQLAKLNTAVFYKPPIFGIRNGFYIIVIRLYYFRIRCNGSDKIRI